MAKRPSWLDIKPPNKAQADAYAVATKNVPPFKKAFLQLRQDLWNETNKAALLRAIQRQDINGAIDAFPTIDDEAYRNFTSRAMSVYRNTIEMAGQKEWDRLGIKREFSTKAKTKGKPKNSDRTESLRVPINEHSKVYMRTRSASLVRDISKTQREVLREILADNFDKGNRPEVILAAIQNTVGLTARQAKATENRRQAMLDAGADEERALAGSYDYGSQLLRERANTIARTETNDAQNAGLFDSWEVAQENDYLPPTMRKEWVALDHSPRTSDICLELDGQQVGLDEQFYSSVLGEYIDRPPAHPNCRSTVVLVEVEQ